MRLASVGRGSFQDLAKRADLFAELAPDDRQIRFERIGHQIARVFEQFDLFDVQLVQYRLAPRFDTGPTSRVRRLNHRLSQWLARADFRRRARRRKSERNRLQHARDLRDQFVVAQRLVNDGPRAQMHAFRQRRPKATTNCDRSSPP